MIRVVDKKVISDETMRFTRRVTVFGIPFFRQDYSGYDSSRGNSTIEAIGFHVAGDEE